MQRLGAFQDEGHVEALARHLALPLDERLRRSLELSKRLMPHANLGGREDDPTPFYARARALGLYEG